MIKIIAFITLSLWSSALLAQANEQAQSINLMNQYLSLSEQVVDIASRPESTIFMAVEGIFEVYEQRKDAPGAIEHLERILADSNNQTVRNIVRLKLRDIYKETGQIDKALDQLDLVIKENS